MAVPDYRFNGPEYVPDRDNPRLDSQLDRVKALMLDGEWRTLQMIGDATGDPVASVSAQLRHLRKPRFGSYLVDRRHVGGGLYEYRVRQPPTPVEPEDDRSLSRIVQDEVDSIDAAEEVADGALFATGVPRPSLYDVD